jgi:hypothetical protein
MINCLLKKQQLLRFFILSMLLSCLQLGYSQNCFFAKKIGSENDPYDLYREKAKNILSDAQQNIYILGTYFNSADLDPGSGTFSVTGSDENSFIVKLDANGNFIWGLSFPISNNAFDMSIDNNSNLIVIGVASQNVDLDPGVGKQLATARCSYILKLTTSGTMVWIKPYYSDYSNGETDVFFTKVTADNSNNIILTGKLSGASYDMDLGGGISIINGTTRYNISKMDFVTKVNSSGNFVWVKTFVNGSPTSDILFASLKSDTQGNIIISGNFKESIDFDPDPSSQFDLYGGFTSPYSQIVVPTVFICKLNSNGSFVWTQSFNVLGIVKMAIDRQNNIFLSGAYLENSDLNGGAGTFKLSSYVLSGSNYFITKINSAGVFQWAKRFGGKLEAAITALICDDNNNVYAAIYNNFANSATPTTGPDFDPGLDSVYADYNGFGLGVFKLDSQGDFVSRKTFYEGSASNNGAAKIESFYVKNGFVFSTGLFPKYGNDFDPDPRFNTVMTAAGYKDVFICKFSVLSISVQSKVNPTCSNKNDGSITINVLDGHPPYSYSWSGYPSNNSGTLNNLPAGTYSCIVTDGSGCSHSIPPVTLTSPPPINISFSTTNENCVNNGNNGSAISSVNGGTLPYQYAWNLESQSNGPDIQNVSAGSYSLTITDALGCLKSESVTVGYTYNPSSFSYTTNGMVASFVRTGTGCDKFVWDFGNGNTSTINPNPTVTYLAAGTYGVCLQCNDQPSECVKCVNITVPSIISGGTTVGIEEAQRISDIKVYPNPTTDFITIENRNSKFSSTYTILNLTGQPVLIGNLIGESTTVGVNKLSSGIYLLQVGETEKHLFKFVKK